MSHSELLHIWIKPAEWRSFLAACIMFVTLLFMGCGENENQDSGPMNDTIAAADSLRIDTLPPVHDTIPETDSLLVQEALPKVRVSIADPLAALRQLVATETGKSQPDQVFISNPDSIRALDYVTEMFPVDKIDSIEFYGIVGRYYRNPDHMHLGSLLILYFNDNARATEELDSLEDNWKDNFRATEAMFKAGGMAFELEDQLCIYSVNTCGPGYRNLLRIDTLVSEQVFGNHPFERLHAGCGMGPFKRIEH